MKDTSIFVNQIGYKTDGSKKAFVKNAEEGDSFFIAQAENPEKIVYKGKLPAPVKDEVSGESVSCADFSDFALEGTYCIFTDESQKQKAKSVNFKIGNGIFDDVYFSTLNYFYLSRCGQDIENEEWGHPACHTGIAKIYGTELTKNVQGGWHDAGDYGRYVVAASKAVMDLLLAYECQNKNYSRFDILDEVRFELEWMLQMQREDGGVYHKISCYHFCPFILPQEEKDELVLAPVSTSATADFAGCLSFAYGFYKKVDSTFADKLLSAALKAQQYLDTHEDELYKNPPEITTGGYGDWNVRDERYFALCSLFASTGNKEYLNRALEVKAQAKKMPDDESCLWKKAWSESFAWGCVAGYGSEILIKNENLIEDKKILAELKKDILAEVEAIYNVVKNASFETALKIVFWGSNGQACDLAHMLLLGYDITGEKKYYEAALSQFNYVMGCNPLDICYVTGYGTNTVINPHHRPSGALGKCMPGMLSGGPCAGLVDEVAKKYLQGKAPLQCFIDIQGSYSTNEIAIYWNSPFVYLVAKLGLI